MSASFGTADYYLDKIVEQVGSARAAVQKLKTEHGEVMPIPHAINNVALPLPSYLHTLVHTISLASFSMDHSIQRTAIT